MQTFVLLNQTKSDNMNGCWVQDITSHFYSSLITDDSLAAHVSISASLRLSPLTCPPYPPQAEKEDLFYCMPPAGQSHAEDAWDWGFERGILLNSISQIPCLSSKLTQCLLKNKKEGGILK